MVRQGQRLEGQLALAGRDVGGLVMDCYFAAVARGMLPATSIASERVKQHSERHGMHLPWRAGLPGQLQAARPVSLPASEPSRSKLIPVGERPPVQPFLAAQVATESGADGSIAKLSTARICQQSRDLAYRIAGSALLLQGPGSPMGGDLQRVNLASPGNRIGGDFEPQPVSSQNPPR